MTEQCFFDLLKQIRDYAEECNDFAKKNIKKDIFPLDRALETCYN